jgi:nucleoid DNA-binding protein
MIKYDLVRTVEEKAGLSHTEATKAVDQAISIMKETLAYGETIKRVFSASVHEFPSNVGLESVIQK